MKLLFPLLLILSLTFSNTYGHTITYTFDTQKINPSEIADEDHLSPYLNHSLGISTQYPSYWYFNNYDNGVAFTSLFANTSDKYVEEVNILSYALGKESVPYFTSLDIPLENLAMSEIEYLKDVFNDTFSSKESHESFLGGVPAYWITYTYSENMTKFRTFELLGVYDTKIWFFNYVGEDS